MNAKRLAKKFAAISMIAAMVVTAPAVTFAADETASGTISSTGESTGHVAKSRTRITFPTITEEDIAFNVDPERLIDATSAGAGGFNAVTGELVTPNAAGVYFTGNNCESSTKTFSAVNIGTENIDLSIELKTATASGTMALTDSASAWDTEGTAAHDVGTGKAAMYIGVRGIQNTGGTLAASEDKVALTGTSVKLEKTLTGNAANYVVTRAGAGYSFAMAGTVDSITNPAAGWDAFDFVIEGASQIGSAEENAAPSFDVTWTWKGADDPYTQDGYAAVVGPVDGANYLGMKKSNSDAGKFEEGTEATKVTVNGIDVTSKSTLLYGWIAVKAADLTASGIELDGVTPLVTEFEVDGITYTGTYAWN